MKANIMEIERFAIHDGPGIRTVVFLQGCPLHCPWCANPESQSMQAQLMYQRKKCIGCQTCVKHCPAHAIEVIQQELVFHRERCLSCKTCEENCPAEAIHFIGKQAIVDEIMAEVRKDKCFYEESNGGITLSGGEPFVQYEACRALLQASKQEGICTAVETTGDYAWERLKECIPLIDIFLFDFKHCDLDKLHQTTGADGERIMQNLKQLSMLVPDKITLRIPVIPGFNYEATVLKKMIDIAKELQVSSVHLLPYHTLGLSKYEQLDRKYELKGVAMLQKEDLKDYAAYGKSKGIHVQAGG